MNTWKRSNNTQGGKKRLLLGGLVLGLVSVCNGMGHSKMMTTDIHPTQNGMGRRGNIFAQLTTRQLDSGINKLAQQDGATPELSFDEKPVDAIEDTQQAAKVEKAVNAITEELNKVPNSDDTSTSSPVTSVEEVIPHAETSSSTSQVENAAAGSGENHRSDDDKDFIDFTPVEDNQVEATAHEEIAVESANTESAATVSTNDQINNSVESSNTLDL